MAAEQPRGTQPDRVREVTAAVEDQAELVGWASRFALLGDPNRLRLLYGIHRAGEICVSDLAAGVGMSHTATSQALRLLRMHDWVATRRDGRLILYRLNDGIVHDLLHQLGATHGPHTEAADRRRSRVESGS